MPEFTHLEGDRFPQLRDTRFPNIATVDVYAFRNTFDYSRWSEKTVVRLVNVLWDSTFNDVPYFATTTERDEWFDSIEDGYAIRLEQAARIVPEGYAKLPLPYDIAARYNYLYVDVPFATSSSEPIDYEETHGIRRWYFFVERVEYGSPNSTHVYLTIDYWTTFRNELDIKYMMLERGHAPMGATTVESYLQSPISNNQYLLAPDVDFGRSTRVSNSTLIPFGNGTKYCVFITIASLRDMGDVGNIPQSGTWTAPVFNNSSDYPDPDRDGQSVNVAQFAWGDGRHWEDMQTKVRNGNATLARVPNNTYALAIPASECIGGTDGTFMTDVTKRCPAFVQACQAMLMVDESMIDFADVDPIVIAGHSLSYCRGVTEQKHDFDLRKSDFGFPERYADFAKLYTSPYSILELTDNEGRTIDVRIEDTGQITYQRITSIAFPYLDMRVLFDGIGGTGSKSYTWKSLTGDTSNLSMGNDDWGEVKFDWDIPTYALYLDGETLYNMRQQYEIWNGRLDAVTGYQTGMRDANCAQQNAIALANTARTNAYNNSGAAYSNDIKNANVTDANAANSVNAATLNTIESNSLAAANVARANLARQRIVTYGADRLQDDTTSANNALWQNAGISNDAVITTTANTGNAQVEVSGVQGGVSMGIQGGMAGAAGGGATAALGAGLGMIAGALVGQYTASEQVAAANTNATILGNVNYQQAEVYQNRNIQAVQHQGLEMAQTYIEQNSAATDQQVNNADALTAQTTNNNNATTSNAANTSGAIRQNAQRNRTAAETNADNTRNTTVSNANATRADTHVNLDAIMVNQQRKAENRLISSRNAMPQSFGVVSGKPEADYQRTRGVQVKVRTESDGAIAQAGDHFARYGYALNQVWDVGESGLCPMTDFCYWKASDLWIDDRVSSTNEAGKAIERIFLDGTTVWRNPSEIGRVSIYDNEPVIPISNDSEDDVPVLDGND